MKEELKIKTETYYALQKIRIQAELRIKQFVRDGRLSKIACQVLHLWMDDVLKKAENSVKADIKTIIKDVPIWKAWLKKVKGIGPCLGGSLVAEIDISLSEYTSSLWKYSGQSVIHFCSTCHSIVDQENSSYNCPKCGPIDSVYGEAPRRQRNQKIDWYPFLKTTLFKISDSFIKQDPDKCLYRRIYDERKKFEQQHHPEWNICYACKNEMKRINGFPKCPKCGGKQTGSPHPIRKSKNGKPLFIYTAAHLHNRAKRYCVKMFMQHLWIKWRQLEGLAVTDPWITGPGGHSNYIEPDE